MKKLLLPLFLLISLAQLHAISCSELFTKFLDEITANSPESFFADPENFDDAKPHAYHKSVEELKLAAKTSASKGIYFDYHAEFNYTKQYGELITILANYYQSITYLLITTECDIPEGIKEQFVHFGALWSKVLEGSRKTSHQPGSSTLDPISENFYAHTVFDWQLTLQDTYDKLYAYVSGLKFITDSHDEL